MSDEKNSEADKIVGSTDGLARMLISEQENTALIYASTRDQTFGCAFGPRWVALLPLESNRWAFDLVRQMRANVLLSGAATAIPGNGAPSHRVRSN